MTLVDYINKLSAEDRASFNKDVMAALGVNKAAISHWVSGRQKISPKNAKQLELLTNGLITREELRPDIFA